MLDDVVILVGDTLQDYSGTSTTTDLPPLHGACTKLLEKTNGYGKLDTAGRKKARQRVANILEYPKFI